MLSISVTKNRAPLPFIESSESIWKKNSNSPTVLFDWTSWALIIRLTDFCSTMIESLTIISATNQDYLGLGVLVADPEPFVPQQ